MNRTIVKYIILIASIIFFSILLAQPRNKVTFKNLCDIDGIYKAEVSIFKESKYHQIDCKEFLEILQCSKPILSKFIPHKEVVLFGQDTTYTVYFSGTNTIFQVSRYSFLLKKTDAEKISRILNRF